MLNLSCLDQAADVAVKQSAAERPWGFGITAGVGEVLRPGFPPSQRSSQHTQPHSNPNLPLCKAPRVWPGVCSAQRPRWAVSSASHHQLNCARTLPTLFENLLPPVSNSQMPIAAGRGPSLRWLHHERVWAVGKLFGTAGNISGVSTSLPYTPLRPLSWGVQGRWHFTPQKSGGHTSPWTAKGSLSAFLWESSQRF